MYSISDSSDVINALVGGSVSSLKLGSPPFESNRLKMSEIYL